MNALDRARNAVSDAICTIPRVPDKQLLASCLRFSREYRKHHNMEAIRIGDDDADRG